MNLGEILDWDRSHFAVLCEGFLVHEICHSVVDDGHTDAWVREMRRVARRAKELNKPAVADEVKRHVYVETGRIGDSPRTDGGS